MLEEIKNIPNSNKDIRSFGITMGIILFIISGLLMYYNKEIYQIIGIIALMFIGLGLVIPVMLKPFYFVWMRYLHSVKRRHKLPKWQLLLCAVNIGL